MRCSLVYDLYVWGYGVSDSVFLFPSGLGFCVLVCLWLLVCVMLDGCGWVAWLYWILIAWVGCTMKPLPSCSWLVIVFIVLLG